MLSTIALEKKRDSDPQGNPSCWEFRGGVTGGGPLVAVGHCTRTAVGGGCRNRQGMERFVACLAQ